MLTVDLERLDSELREFEEKAARGSTRGLDLRLAILQARIDLVRLKLELEGK